ncbi:hypothetical protein CROQUDRAFT_650434 [Cronartium quercuum f. sp. fusiforme G11]|uniref:Uncharacterized protein n=1 Tax=Cronartium quercuum f. sp. fusiforme G11 TaxID=708437 RepID=A0A9P6NTW3_9BASI|nr:hypothetical protein CROQUDRAFT_650434 [Cronartium quercuum f. sp. fusiforme G11]
MRLRKLRWLHLHPSPRKAALSLMESRPQNLVVIVGTTGTGKSQLGIELSRHLSSSADPSKAAAEIINGDSMQVYKGLDILTNKVSPSEMMGVPHHLMSFLDDDEDYTVERFREDADKKVQEIHDRGKLPIVVGGTGYYIQNLILPGRLSKDAASAVAGLNKDIKALEASNSSPPNQLTREHILNYFTQKNFPSALVEDFGRLPTHILQLCFLTPSLPPFSSPKAFPPNFPISVLPIEFQPPTSTAETFCLGLYQALQVVDPAMAQRWHWRDLRKVRRSLEVAVCTGRRMSEVVSEQDDMERRSPDNRNRVPYRTLIFWLYADPSELGPRLDIRIDKMIESGLVKEVQYLRRKRMQSQRADAPTDVSRGPYQAIGYREFETCSDDTWDELCDPTTNQSHIKKATELMKISTRKYAKSQVKWMTNKFLPEVNKLKMKSNPGIELYLLDATDLENWHKNVFMPAQGILEAFLEGAVLPEPSSLSPISHKFLSSVDSSLPRTLGALKMRTCSICTTDPTRAVMIEESVWDVHTRSKRHRKAKGHIREAKNAPVRDHDSPPAKRLKVDDERPKVDDEHPKVEDEHPKVDDEHPKVGDEHPKVDDEHPKVDDEHPKVDDEHPKVDDEHPKVDDEQS